MKKAVVKLHDVGAIVRTRRKQHAVRLPRRQLKSLGLGPWLWAWYAYPSLEVFGVLRGVHNGHILRIQRAAWGQGRSGPTDNRMKNDRTRMMPKEVGELLLK